MSGVVDRVRGSVVSPARWVERSGDRRPPGTFTVEEIVAEGLVGVPVFVTRRVYRQGRKVAVAGDVLTWEQALELGLVSPPKVDRRPLHDRIETRRR